MLKILKRERTLSTLSELNIFSNKLFPPIVIGEEFAISLVLLLLLLRGNSAINVSSGLFRRLPVFGRGSPGRTGIFEKCIGEISWGFFSYYNIEAVSLLGIIDSWGCLSVVISETIVLSSFSTTFSSICWSSLKVCNASGLNS